MKLLDAIINVNRDGGSSSPWDAVGESLGLPGIASDLPNEAYDALQAYPIYNWYCTDEHVGLDALYLNDTPVGGVYRSGRKSSYRIEWISEDRALEVRDFILRHMPKSEPAFGLLDPEEDIGEDFNVEFVGQSLTDEGTFEGRPVRALVRYDGLTQHTTEEKYRQKGRSYTVGVPFRDPKSNCLLVQDGEEQRIIPIAQFRLAFNVKKDEGEPCGEE